MKWIKILSGLGIIIMAAGIIRGFVIGDFSSEGTRLLGMPWGQVSMIDLYTGFILFSIWIIYREKTIWKALIWFFFMLTLGFFTGSVYMFLAAQNSGGDWAKFWMGDRITS